MSAKKIIAVIGATGAQGGGLCAAILGDPNSEFVVRAITRDTTKDAARALAAKGAEVVAGNLDDMDSLRAAFAGAYGVYAVTNFWEHFSAEQEKTQAKKIADAARAEKVQHVIWSTLEDTRAFMHADDTRMPMLQTHYRVPHFDAKSEADAYFEGVPTTLLFTSFYWDNLYSFGLAPKKGEDGTYSWAFPMGDKRIAGIAAEDIGKVAHGIFKAGPKFIGQSVGIASEFLTVDEMGTQLSNVLGIGPITYHAVDADAYRGFGFPGADEMGNMFQIYRDFETEVMARRDPVLARELNPDLLTYTQFLSKYSAKIPV